MDALLVRWRDIPSQIIVKQGRKRAKVLLSARFQSAIDRAAMRAKKRTADAYISEWEREAIPLEPADGATDLQAIADRLAEGVEADYSDTRLLALIRNHGSQEG
ncbi:MAG: virulence factor [Gammaproteobacteria bacterium]|nr:virulence factor [Gammaproteobacteria bacterium]